MAESSEPSRMRPTEWWCASKWVGLVDEDAPNRLTWWRHGGVERAVEDAPDWVVMREQTIQAGDLHVEIECLHVSCPSAKSIRLNLHVSRPNARSIRVNLYINCLCDWNFLESLNTTTSAKVPWATNANSFYKVVENWLLHSLSSLSVSFRS